MHSPDNAPSLLCQDCGTLLDTTARCPSCWGGSQTPIAILAYQIVLSAEEFGSICPALLVERMREMREPHFERAAVALERAMEERKANRGRMAAA